MIEENNIQPGYRYLSAYKMTVIDYDLTVEFCKRWIDKHSRTFDQMVQAARSGKQNIAEGYMEKSLKMYIKLAGVAFASLEELKEDYLDFLRQRKLAVWPASHPKIKKFRAFRVHDGPEHPQIPQLSNDQEEAANMLLTYINMTQYLLKKLIDSLEKKFVKEGGYTEKLFHKRLDYRRSH